MPRPRCPPASVHKPPSVCVCHPGSRPAGCRADKLRLREVRSHVQGHTGLTSSSVAEGKARFWSLNPTPTPAAPCSLLDALVLGIHPESMENRSVNTQLHAPLRVPGIRRENKPEQTSPPAGSPSCHLSGIGKEENFPQTLQDPREPCDSHLLPLLRSVLGSPVLPAQARGQDQPPPGSYLDRSGCRGTSVAPSSSVQRPAPSVQRPASGRAA